MAEAIEPTLANMTDINAVLISVLALEQDSYDWYARHHNELALERRLQPRLV